MIDQWLEPVCEISRRAGNSILQIYQKSDIHVESKSDDSPLTEADLASHRLIELGLTSLSSKIPILSEESAQVSFSQRKQWSDYWLVDPLDGTKEFINRNGEFTVNIAYISEGVPILGVVYVPVKDILYVGCQAKTPFAQAKTPFAYKEENGRREQIRIRPMTGADSLTLVASRRHGSEAQQQLMELLAGEFENLEIKNMGSSLKLCLVAEGVADLYPRLAPTSEWDTAAAQAVVEAAGGQVVDANFQALRYNTKESLLNPYFYVLGDVKYPWQQMLGKLRL